MRLEDCLFSIVMPVTQWQEVYDILKYADSVTAKYICNMITEETKRMKHYCLMDENRR